MSEDALLSAWQEFVRGGLIRDWPQARAEIAYVAFCKGWAAGRAAERERIRMLIAGEIVLNGPFPDGVTERIGPLLEGDTDGK